MIVVVDYGMGNLRSIAHKLSNAGLAVTVTSDPEVVARADKLILPGVGHFAEGMRHLKNRGLRDVLDDKVARQCTPILGICLGLQLFSRHSEEGDAAGLGWLDGCTRRFAFNGHGPALRVPHVGWNTLQPAGPPWFPADAHQRFYFTHSYHLCDVDPDAVLATTRYGYDFVSMIRRGHLYGTQFHPEKSHRRGFAAVEAFARSA